MFISNETQFLKGKVFKHLWNLAILLSYTLISTSMTELLQFFKFAFAFNYYSQKKE